MNYIPFLHPQIRPRLLHHLHLHLLHRRLQILVQAKQYKFKQYIFSVGLAHKFVTTKADTDLQTKLKLKKEENNVHKNTNLNLFLFDRWFFLFFVLFQRSFKLKIKLLA